MALPTKQFKVPTYMRQRLLLFFLEAAGGALSKVDLQKLLFLYHEETGVTHYAFVPYRFGSYSFLAGDDIDLMEKRGWVATEDKQLFLTRDISREEWAKSSEERRFVKQWLNRNPERGDTLVAKTYRCFPYYAIHSEMKGRLLAKDELKAIDQAMPTVKQKDATILITIGYEGIHFETYLNKLIKNCVDVLCDVRRNPLSRKFGFSSKMLAKVLPTLGIEYAHLPELGIESEQRQELHTMADYQQLFAGYRRDLPNRIDGLSRLRAIIDGGKRVALTCFEAEPHCCHRHCISDYLEQIMGLTIQHQ